MRLWLGQVTALSVGAVVFLSGCGTTAPPTRSYGSPSYASAARTSGADASEAEPSTEDANSGFALESENAEAKSKIEAALRVFDQSKQTAATFTANTKTKTPAKCDSLEMVTALQNIQVVELGADKYNQRTAVSSAPSEREAAMDVADELNAIVLDSYFEIARGYRTAKCYARARFLLEELQRIYVGDSFEKWRSDAEAELKALALENPRAKSRTPKKSAPPTKKIWKSGL